MLFIVCFSVNNRIIAGVIRSGSSASNRIFTWGGGGHPTITQQFLRVPYDEKKQTKHKHTIDFERKTKIQFRVFSAAVYHFAIICCGWCARGAMS